MTQLEIIHLRSSGESIEALIDRIKESIGKRGDRISYSLYRSHGLDTDLAVHILRSDVAVEQGPSDLALRLAAEFRAYGLVEHTVWEERG